MIRDCGGDSKVKSDILENREKLKVSNYEKILGLRDAYPSTLSDLPKLIRGLKHGVPMKPISIHIALAVIEIEAWFIAEGTHFPRISVSLTLELIKRSFGLDLETDNVELLPHPSESLNNIYKLAGLAYKKDRSIVTNTVNALDYEELYLNVTRRVSYFAQFISHIDSFLN